MWWDWFQALLITGFEIHGSYSLLGFGDATRLHTIGAWSLIVLWLFAIFWHITTGEWRQYVPSRDGLFAVMHCYLKPMVTGYENLDEPAGKP